MLLLRDAYENLIAIQAADADEVHAQVVRLLNPARGSGLSSCRRAVSCARRESTHL